MMSLSTIHYWQFSSQRRCMPRRSTQPSNAQKLQLTSGNLKPARETTPTSVELSILDRSRRRCALCFYLDGNLEEKHGQLAHLDDDRSNYSEDNIAFLCMKHHSVYDSTTSQHKNYTLQEAKAACMRLYKAISHNEHLRNGPVTHRSIAGDVGDRKTLNSIVQLMAETESINFLRTNNFAGWSFNWETLAGIDEIRRQHGPEREFLDPELEALRQQFLNCCGRFIDYTAYNTFTVGSTGRHGVPSEWEYEQPDRFIETVRKLHDLADELCATYDAFIRSARRKLAV